MSALAYVTSNPGKFRSASLFFPPGRLVHQSGLEIPEPGTDVAAVAGYKAAYALSLGTEPPFFVHDTSLYGDNLPGLEVGPLLRKKGRGMLAGLPDNHPCYSRQCVAYVDPHGEMELFQSEVRFRLIHEARGDASHRWTALWRVLVPEGMDKTLAELTPDEYRNWTLSLPDGGLETTFPTEYRKRNGVYAPADERAVPC